MGSTATIVMAGGLGTRMRSDLPKVLHELRGRPMLEWVVDAARQAGSDEVVAVVSPQIADAVRARLPDLALAVQSPPLGTGHAVEVGLAALAGTPEAVVVLSGDTPAIDPSTVEATIAARADASADAALVTMRVPPPHAYGRVVRGDGVVAKIVEARDASPAELALDECNAGLYCFRTAALADALARVGTQNDQGERYLTDAVGVIAAGGTVVAVEEPDAASVEGVNTMVELAALDMALRQRLCERAMLAGARIVDPATTYLDWSVALEPGCTIEPFTTLQGATRVAEGAIVGPYAVACDALIGAGCRVGPFAYLRPGAVLEEAAQVGRFVEIKSARIGARSKVPHLAYVGDADVGEDVNLGAGTITANYDGQRKHRTIVEDRAKTSSNSVLVAPVTVGEGSTVAAGSVITEDVPAGALAIARPRQTNIEGYAERRKGAEK